MLKVFFGIHLVVKHPIGHIYYLNKNTLLTIIFLVNGFDFEVRVLELSHFTGL